jgi:hypothetical protein
MTDPRRIRTRAEWTGALQTLFSRAGLSYNVLATRCGGISTSTLQQMVTGQSFPRPSTVRLFVHACGESDAQPWVDARNRVAAGDMTVSRSQTQRKERWEAGVGEEPVIATVERKPPSPLTPKIVTVDDDPPKEMTIDGTIHSILLEARTAQAVTLREMRAVVVDRQDPRRACMEPPRIGAALKSRPFTANFDVDPPRLTALKDDFPFTISPTDPEQFDIEPRVSFHEVSWILEIDWTWQGGKGTTVVDDDGKPFEIYPTPVLWHPGRPSPLNWGCDTPTGHVAGCPAERLLALRRAGAAPMPDAGRARAELEAEFPDWRIWRSDAGRWYATHREPGRGGTVVADSPNGLRIKLHAQRGRPGATP